MDLTWTGDLNRDCTALWNGIIFRAEVMDDDTWWWAVYDQVSGEELAASNSPIEAVCLTGEDARQTAEAAAKCFREFPRLD